MEIIQLMGIGQYSPEWDLGGRVKEFWPFLKAIKIGRGSHGSRGAGQGVLAIFKGH